MNNDIAAYLTTVKTQCERAERPEDRFALAAVQRLMLSKAYQTGNLAELKRLVYDLKTENCVTIFVARAHPDVFHENVIHSRKSENAIYDGVIALIDRINRETGSEAA